MTSLYIPYASGPWACDDSWAHTDGVQVNGTEHNTGIITLDGTNAARKPMWSQIDSDVVEGRKLREDA